MSLSFTTSWDDGYLLDLKLAEMLGSRGMRGTFYVCPGEQHEQPMLSKEQVKALSASHEIGAHSLTHPHLVSLDREFVEQEIVGSRKWVEDVTGRRCTMFCYPYGDFDGITIRVVRDAGFVGARTTETLRFTASSPYMLPTTLQVSPFPERATYSRWWHPLDRKGPLRVKKKRLKEIGIPRSAWGDWLSLATALFDHAVATEQPFFHLWGHSAEIEKYGMWDELDAFLTYVSAAGAEPATNRMLAAHFTPTITGLSV